MNINWEQEWDRKYKDQGEVQFDVLLTVRVATDISETGLEITKSKAERLNFRFI